MADPQNLGRRATYDDILQAPEHMVAEIVDGELYLSPRPASPHAFAHSALGGELYAPFQKGRGGPGGWWLLTEPELHFGEDVLVPDLAGWRRERMPAVPDAPYFTLAPDWVCEVLSPSTKRFDRFKKWPVYARERVAYAWFVEPLAKTVEIFTLQGTELTLVTMHQGQERIRAVPFDAIEIDLTDLWSDAGAGGERAETEASS